MGYYNCNKYQIVKNKGMVMKLFKSFAVLGLTVFSGLFADTLVDAENFNVTLKVASAHYLQVNDLDFGFINPREISGEDGFAMTSTTGNLIAYSNSPSGHYVQIVASDNKYLSSDGYSFLMLGVSPGNNDSIPFYLQTSLNADGSKATDGARDILPGYIILSADGEDDQHKVTRDLWAVLRDNNVLKSVASDGYIAVLVANHYENG